MESHLIYTKQCHLVHINQHLHQQSQQNLKVFVLVLIELRLFVLADVVFKSVSSLVGLSNTNCGSCFERRGRFRDGDSEVRVMGFKDRSSCSLGR